MRDIAALLSALLWPAVVAYGLWRFAPIVERFVPRSLGEAIADNAVVEVPDDLVAFAMQEREAWAQQEVLRAVRERYEELRDWNKVRIGVGIGRIDA